MLKIQVIGHVGQDAKINQVNNRKVINFSVAHTERFKDKETTKDVEKTVWVNIQYWTDNTRVAEFLTKGRLVYVEGYPNANIFTNRDNQKMAGLNCRCTSIQLLGKNDKRDDAPAAQGQNDLEPFDEYMNTPTPDVF